MTQCEIDNHSILTSLTRWFIQSVESIKGVGRELLVSALSYRRLEYRMCMLGMWYDLETV